MSKLVMIVIDSLGIGAQEDAHAFGDVDASNTFGHVLAHATANGIIFPNLRAIGLQFLLEDHPESDQSILAKLHECSKGKDTVAGHWELCGVITPFAYPTFPDGFPESMLQVVRRLFQTELLGNERASGTEIINRLGDQHCQTGYPIVYTSSDSVLQIAAHESVIPPKTLHALCAALRTKLQTPQTCVSRIIARPFVGNGNGQYTRTANRRDFTVPVPEHNVLSQLLQAAVPVISIGKIGDIFPNVSFTEHYNTISNEDGMARTCAVSAAHQHGMIMTNLVDFDAMYGHRRDIDGYARALKTFDQALPRLINTLQPGDALLLTADHGCDPAACGNDHTREYVPFVFHISGSSALNGYRGVRPCFTDCAATIADYFSLPHAQYGRSMLQENQ